MPLHAPLPDAWREALLRRWPRHRVLYALATDLARQKRYGEGFLAVVDTDAPSPPDTPDDTPPPGRLRLIYGENGGNPPDELSFKDFAEIRVDERFGASFLVAVLKDGGERRLARYSRARVPEAGLMCRVVNDLAAGRPALLPDDAEGAARCPRCGHPLPERGGVCVECVRPLAVLQRLTRLLAPYRGRIALMMAATVLSIAAKLAPPMLVQRITDEVIVGVPADNIEKNETVANIENAQSTAADSTTDAAGNMGANENENASAKVNVPSARTHRVERLPWYIGWMVFCAAAYFGFQYVGTYLSSWLSSRIVADLRTELHRHLQRLRLSYFAKRGDGDLVSRVMHDTQELHHFLVDGLPYLVVNSIAFVAIAAILLWMDWRLALVVFVPVPFLAVGVRWIRVRLEALFAKDGSLHGALFSLLGESVRGIKAVKAATRETARGERFADANTKLFEVNVNIDKNYIFFAEGVQWITALATAGVWYFAAVRIAGGDGTLPLGTLMAYVYLIGIFYGPLQWFTVIANWMNHALAAAERVFTILDTRPEDYAAPAPATSAVATTATGAVTAALPARARGEIRFRDVRFSYERGKEVVKGISFDLHPGEMLGLVGRSGAGKSTLVNLLCRFHEIDGGVIELDGRPLRDWPLDLLRRQIGFVMQEPFLFRASILENIRYGQPDADFARVVRAARAANAHDFILDKELGYDTIVGDGGVSLSGGEKQRVAIARALLNDPPILILDEATSSVDTGTEKRIQDALTALVKGRSVIAIAHRLATLRHADRLLVIDEGRLVESGTHEELLARGGRYAELVRTQTELNRIKAESTAL